MIRRKDSYSDGGNDSNGVSRALEAKLASLQFKAFRNCVVLWLGGRGYREVRSLDRRHRRGRRRVGGADFIVSTSGVFPLRVAVQIRHWRTPIQRRAVDELRGFMLRHNVPSGLIVASEEFSQKARLTARWYPGRPIAVVGPRQLAESMYRLGQGVVRSDAGERLDERYFRSLAAVDFAGRAPFRRVGRSKSRQRQSHYCVSLAARGCLFHDKTRRLLLGVASVLLVLATVLYLILHGRPS
jgi:hypothetical protein